MKTITLLSVIAVCVSLCLGQAAFPGLTANGTVEIEGPTTFQGNSTSAGVVSGSTLSRTCLLLTRQKGKWTTNNGSSYSYTTFGAYEPAGVTTAANYASFGISNGALINPILDVSAAGDIDLGVWLTVSSTSPCIARYTCSGSLFKYTYTLTGIVCSSTVAGFGQCGGEGYTGSTLCASGFVCTVSNPFFSQCLPA